MSDGKLFDSFAQCLDNLWNLLRSDKPESKFSWTSQLGWNRDSARKQRRKSQVSDLIWKYGAWSYQNIRQNIYNKLLDISRIEKLYILIFWINGIIREKLRYFITYLRISNLSFINRWDRRRQKLKKKLISKYNLSKITKKRPFTLEANYNTPYIVCESGVQDIEL